MKSLITLLTALILWPASLFADTWRDPSFREMMSNSDVIGLFRVVEGGSFKARLIPIAIYKGKLEGDIWLGGFSNKYGPIDTFSTGQLYVLFVNKVKNHTNRYSSSSNAGNQGVARAAYEGYNFVTSQKNGYLVPTPTTGEYHVKNEKVFIDLADVNETIDGFPLEDLKRLIEQKTGADRTGFVEHCKEQITKNLSSTNVYLLTNYLSLLELMNESAYDTIFEQVANHASWQARFTLAKLLGNVKGDKPRDLLVAMMADSLGSVQGEAIRQLAKTQPANFLGPLLVRQLDAASILGMYPSLMSPVRNARESAKVEIVNTLAQLKYKPSIPYLIALLRTADDYLFNRTIAALTELDAKEYIPVLNERLADPALSASLLFEITRIVEKQKLTECKDALLTQLAQHNRNENRDKTILLSTLTVLAEEDSSIESALINDFNHFFSYYDTLQSFNQEKWIEEYIKTFATIKSEKSRPLIYRALYEWTGFRPDLHPSPEAFQKKRANEDSIRNQFIMNRALKEYKLKDVIFFSAPTPSFLVSIKLPDNKATFERRKFIADQMALNENKVYLVAKEDWCWLDCQDRFQKNTSSVVRNYIEYAEALPTKTDLNFLKTLMKSDRWEAKYFDRELSKAVDKIEKALAGN